MAHVTALRKEKRGEPGDTARKRGLKSPWHRNSVRRRWTYIIFAVMLVTVALLAMANLGLPTELMAKVQRVPLFILGFAALPLLYPLARRLGASRATALWAMALLGASVPWLLALRECGSCALLPFLVTLAVYCYTRLLAGHAWAWLGVGLTLIALFLANPWMGAGIALGLSGHAAGWVRDRAQVRALAWAGLIFVVGAALLALAPPAGSLLQDIAGGRGPLLSHLLLLNALVLPALATPLCWLALFPDPAQRWRAHPEAALLGLVILGAVIVTGFAPLAAGQWMLLGLAPLGALWLAMGLARLQSRTPAWVWVPVSLLLVLTTLPQTLVGWGAQAIGLTRRIPDAHVASTVAPRADRLVPLVPYVTRELTGNALD